jgi:hypothetical protein
MNRGIACRASRARYASVRGQGGRNKSWTPPIEVRDARLGVVSKKTGGRGVADMRTESLLPFGDRTMWDIVGNSMHAPTLGRSAPAARAFKISCMSQHPMLCPTRSTRVVGSLSYATRSSSRNSRCAWIWARSATLDFLGHEQLLSM